MKILLIARTIKSYWATDLAQKRVTRVFAPFNASPLWRIFGGIFSFPLYFLVSLVGFLKSAKFNLVIAADPRIGIIFGLLKNFFNSKKPLLVHQLILTESANNLKEKILRTAFKKIDAAVANSNFEAKNFAKKYPATKFFFIPIHSDPRCFEIAKKTRDEDYIFSGGGTERDFAILIAAADKIKFKFLIVTFSPKNLPKIKLPENIEVKFNVSEDEYFELIASSKFVVVPVKKVGRSAGQTTVVQAMSIGKTVIATNVSGLVDYIRHGETGILVESENLEVLVTNIDKLLENPQELKRISENAFQFAQKNFTYQIYDQRMAWVLEETIKNLKSPSN